jgi:hypothetical protein
MSTHLKSELRRPAISGAWSNPYNAARKGREAEAYITDLETRVREQDLQTAQLTRDLAAATGVPTARPPP